MKKSQDGFSLVEIAIVMVIIGVIMGAISIGKDTKTSADATKLFKKRVESCIAVAYGAGDSRIHEKYDGSEIDGDGDRLKHFCKIIKKSNGVIKAKIYAPSDYMAVLMYEKARDVLSPDDFIVQPDTPENDNFTIAINNGYEDSTVVFEDIPGSTLDPDSSILNPDFEPNDILR